MRIVVASDHRGFDLKSRVVRYLQELGHEVGDEGPHEMKMVDYPDYARLVGVKVSAGEADRGVLICGTGIGMAIAANKFARVRAATCHDELTAEIGRRHNDVNVLCLSGDMFGQRPIEGILRKWLETPFEGGRHQRRLEKIGQSEQAS